MARPRKSASKAKQQPKQQPTATDTEMKHPFAAVLVVLVLVVAFTVIAYQAFIVGKLFVKVSVADGQSTDPVLVCVYEGDQTDALGSGSAENAPQAVAALLVQPDTETRITGSWHGPYTIAVVDPEGLADATKTAQTVYVGRGETHMGFLIDRAAGTAKASVNGSANAGGATGTSGSANATGATSASDAASAADAGSSASASSTAASSGNASAASSAAASSSASTPATAR